MADDFIAELDAQVGLKEQERDVLAASGVRSYEDLHALVQAFPSIVQLGVELPKLSNAAFVRVPDGFATYAEKADKDHAAVSFGALPPDEASVTPGATVGIPAPLRRMMAMGPEADPIDLRLRTWPVRNQGDRGTCVAFGSVACAEHAAAGAGHSADLSEQFLYWAIKTATSDPYPQQDGTWLEFAAEALASHGVCLETEWPYVGTIVNPVSGAAPGQPSVSAQASAATRRINASIHERNPRQAAKKVLDGLRRGRPVAICLPVFRDPLAPNGPTNWTTSVGWAYGHVLNPPPTSKVTSGHCVCVVGYSPDADEPAGGYFVIRNSWSTDWGSANPDPTSHAPEPGYGFVSATYLNTYTWEILQL